MRVVTKAVPVALTAAVVYEHTQAQGIMCVLMRSVTVITPNNLAFVQQVLHGAAHEDCHKGHAGGANSSSGV